MAEQRARGWYWVRISTYWMPVLWDQGAWVLHHSDFDEIGPRAIPPSAAPSQPQQQDLVAASVFEAEPTQPTNPAVETVERVARAIYEQAPLMGGSNIPHKPHGETYTWNEWKAVAAQPMLEMVYREARAAIAAMPPPSQVSPDPLRVALEYAASTLENEYRSDPTLQDLARSLRAALSATTNKAEDI